MSEASGMTDIDDDQVRVTTWTFDGEGAATGPHLHEYDYVVVPITGGRFTVVDSQGTIREMTKNRRRRIEALPAPRTTSSALRNRALCSSKSSSNADADTCQL